MDTKDQNKQESQDPKNLNGSKAETPAQANGNNPPAEGKKTNKPKDEKPEVDQFKIIKTFVRGDEAAAKEKASLKLGVPGKLLEAKHTDKVFVFQKRQD